MTTLRLLVHAPAYPVGQAMGGIGIRIWELGQVLADAGVQVRILARGPFDLDWPGITFGPPDAPTWRAGLAWADAVLVGDLPDTRLLLAAHQHRKLIVTDNAVPLEHLEYPSVRQSPTPQATYDDLLDRYRLQVLLTDHFIARSEPERLGLVASLALTGRLSYPIYDPAPTLAHLISLVPIGFSPHSDRRAHAKPPDWHGDLVWNGGLWDFLQPTLVLEALAVLADRDVACTVHFLYPPPPDQPLREARRLLAALDAMRDRPGQTTATIERGLLPHDQRDGRLLAARGLVCIAKAGIENDTCHRLRLRDLYLYRKPLLIDRDGATGSLVQRLGVGLAVDRSPTALADAIQRLLTDEHLYARLVGNIDRARATVRYDTTIHGLLDFLHRRSKAPDIGTARHERLVNALLAANPAMRTNPPPPI